MKPCVFSSFDDSVNMQKFKFKLAFYRPFSVVVKDIAIGVGGSPPLRLFSRDSRLCCTGAEMGYATRYIRAVSRAVFGSDSGRSVKNI